MKKNQTNLCFRDSLPAWWVIYQLNQYIFTFFAQVKKQNKTKLSFKFAENLLKHSSKPPVFLFTGRGSVSWIVLLQVKEYEPFPQKKKDLTFPIYQGTNFNLIAVFKEPKLQ